MLSRAVATVLVPEFDINSTKHCFEKGYNVWLYTPQKKRVYHRNSNVTGRDRSVNDLVYKIQSGPIDPTVNLQRFIEIVAKVNHQNWLKVSTPAEET